MPLDQSLLVVWPNLTLLAALTLVCFGLSYVVFMRQGIRFVQSGGVEEMTAMPGEQAAEEAVRQLNRLTWAPPAGISDLPSAI